MIDDAEVSALIKAERARLAVMFILFAISRDIEAKATGDQRFGAAANSVKQIEATMVQVSDDVLINLMSVNETSNGMLTTLITARLRAVGFQLPLLRGCGDVLRAHHGDDGPDTASRTPAHALTLPRRCAVKPLGIASVVPATSSTAIYSGLPVPRDRAHPVSHG